MGKRLGSRVDQFSQLNQPMEYWQQTDSFVAGFHAYVMVDLMATAVTMAFWLEIIHRHTGELSGKARQGEISVAVHFERAQTVGWENIQLQKLLN